MKSTQNGSADGFRVGVYLADSEHRLSDSPGERALAKAFIDAGMAVEVIPADQKTAQPEQSAKAGVFTPVECLAEGSLSPAIYGEGSGNSLPEIEEKSLAKAPEN